MLNENKNVSHKKNTIESTHTLTTITHSMYYSRLRQLKLTTFCKSKVPVFAENYFSISILSFYKFCIMLFCHRCEEEEDKNVCISFFDKILSLHFY